MDRQSDIRALTSVAAAPITANVTDCSYCVPEGHVQGVIDSEEHFGKYAASAAGTKMARVIKGLENFIVKVIGLQPDWTQYQGA